MRIDLFKLAEIKKALEPEKIKKALKLEMVYAVCPTCRVKLPDGLVMGVLGPKFAPRCPKCGRKLKRIKE